jgi:hypothetical protein
MIDHGQWHHERRLGLVSILGTIFAGYAIIPRPQWLSTAVWQVEMVHR